MTQQNLFADRSIEDQASGTKPEKDDEDKNPTIPRSLGTKGLEEYNLCFKELFYVMERLKVDRGKENGCKREFKMKG